VGGLGIVTQFNVKVSDPSQLQAIAAAIDAAFASDQEPTQTRSEKQFVARAATDVLEIVGFTRWLGWGCLAAVLALVGNAIVLAVQDRIREHAVLQTLGFKGHLIARLILAESVLLSLIGALLGSVGALLVVKWTRFSLSVEGLSIPIQADPTTLATGLGLAVLLGVVAGLVPAWQASRREIVDCFRMV
jgi:putative ABC transport system permease protein